MIIPYMIMPGLIRNCKGGENYFYFKEIKDNYICHSDNHTSEISLSTSDHVRLDGAIVWSDSADYQRFKQNPTQPPLNEKKWMMFYFGNEDCYENHLEEAKRHSEEKGVNVMLFNHRAIMDSELVGPCGIEDWVRDGDAFYQFLTAGGVKDEDITIWGHSLGGAISLEERALRPGPIINDGSLDTIQKFLEATINHSINTYSDLPVGTKHKKARLISSIAGFLLRAAGCEFSGVKAWRKNTSDNKLILTRTDDEVMNREGGRLYQELKRSDLQYKKIAGRDKTLSDPNGEIKSRIKHIKVREAHNQYFCRFSEEKQKEVNLFIEKALNILFIKPNTNLFFGDNTRTIENYERIVRFALKEGKISQELHHHYLEWLKTAESDLQTGLMLVSSIEAKKTPEELLSDLEAEKQRELEEQEKENAKEMQSSYWSDMQHFWP